MKIRAHEAEVLVVGADEEQTAEIIRIMLQGCTAEVPSRLPAEVPRRLCAGALALPATTTPRKVSMVLATVSSASREAVRSHRSDRTSTHDGRVAVDLLAPRSHRRYHVVSCELYTERGSVPRRTGAITPRSPC